MISILVPRQANLIAQNPNETVPPVDNGLEDEWNMIFKDSEAMGASRSH